MEYRSGCSRLAWIPSRSEPSSESIPRLVIHRPRVHLRVGKRVSPLRLDGDQRFQKAVNNRAASDAGSLGDLLCITALRPAELLVGSCLLVLLWPEAWPSAPHAAHAQPASPLPK